MFKGCLSLVSLDLSNFNTVNIKNMNNLFYGCNSLTKLNLSNIDTSNVTSMNEIFFECSSLKELDLSSFNTSKVSDMAGMFRYCFNLKTTYVSGMWDTSNVTSSSQMFYQCNLLKGGTGTTYDSGYIDLTYAHVDGGMSNPGYFTLKMI